MIVLSDEEASKSLTSSKTWSNQIAKTFNIDFIVVNVSPKLKNNVRRAQQRQKMKNANTTKR